MSKKPLIITSLLSAAACTAVQGLMHLMVTCQIPTNCVFRRAHLLVRQKQMATWRAPRHCRLLMARSDRVDSNEDFRMALRIVKATWVTHQREVRLHWRPDLVR